MMKKQGSNKTNQIYNSNSLQKQILIPHVNPHQYSSQQSNPQNSVFQRKCQTPSIILAQTKSRNHSKDQQLIKKIKAKSTSKPKDTKDDKQTREKNKHQGKTYYSSKNINKLEPNSSMMSFNNIQTYQKKSIQDRKSPFKHKDTINRLNKNRPISTLSNLRHVRHIQSQLINLSDSLYKSNYPNQTITQSGIKPNKRSQKQPTLITQAKSFMKKQQFQKAIQSLNLFLDTHADSLQALYLIGVCYFHIAAYQFVIKYLILLQSKDQTYRKNMYLFLGIAYKKLALVDDALRIMTTGLKIYTNYLDLLVLRAKLLAKQKRFYDSIQDLNKCLKIQPDNIQAYVSKADCLRNLTQYKQSIKIYSLVLQKTFSLDILLKRAITFIQNQQTQNALNDLNRIITKQPKNSQAFLFKGLAYMKDKNYNQSILSYEQAIKFNTSKKATTKALYEIAKLKIEMGDFYGASYTLERATSLDVDLKVIDKLKTFTDGATFIMKKKYKRGIQLLNILSKKEHLNQQIRSYLFAFRSYGHFCLNKFASSLNDLKQLIKCGFILDNASIYNMTLLQGIIKCQTNEFSLAIQKFKSAILLRPQFGDPHIYIALTFLHQYNRTPKLRLKHRSLLQSSFTHIQQAIQKQQNYNYFYIGALVLYVMGDYQPSLVHLEQAIDKSDDHVMKHFYLRAMVRAMQGKVHEAYTDLNNVISIHKDLKDKHNQTNELNDFDQPHQKEILQVYLNRAKCYLLFGDKKKAFQDLQTYIGQKPLDNQIHMIAGKLLFSIGACQDAIKAYNYSPNVDKNKQALLARAKCYMVLKQLNLSLKDMQRLMQLQDKLIQFDYCCLSALKQASKGQTMHFTSSLQKLCLAQSLPTPHGHIFTLSDLYFYKGVILVMLSQYERAKKFMVKARNLKRLNGEMVGKQGNIDIQQGQVKQQTQGKGQLTDEMFQNKIFNQQELEYNIALCQLMLGNVQKAKETLNKYQGFRKKVFNSQQDFQSNQQSITPFPTTNRLCSIFPQIEYSQNVRFKLTFCLSTVNPIPIQFQTDYKLIQQISMTSIQSRPDAPWIKRNKHGVIFTQNMINVTNSQQMDLRTQKSCKNKYYQNEHDIKIQDDYNQSDQNDYDQNDRPQRNQQHQLNMFLNQQGQYNNNIGQSYQYKKQSNRQQFDKVVQDKSQISFTNFQEEKAKMKNMFLLDNNIEEKLKRIIQKKQT